jgi:putative cardiolipin synthase
MGVELYEMRSDPAAVANLIGSEQQQRHSEKAAARGGQRPRRLQGGTQSRASLHSKAVIIDQRLAVIGSMNLDLRSQLKNSEVGW